MNKQDKQELKLAIQDILWMAARYAHGRSTFSPLMIRDSITTFKRIFPDFEIKQDKVIQPPSEGQMDAGSFRSDYLDDIFNNGSI